MEKKVCGEFPDRQKEFEKFYKDCEFRIVAIKFGEPCPEECKIPQWAI